jgi:AcrR family transcriptional regulator
MTHHHDFKHMRDPEKTRKLILNTAFRQIHEHGFHNVSINDIIAQTNLTKGAFFHYFPTKNDVAYAIIDETLSEMTLERWIRPLAAYKNPLQGIIQHLHKIIDNTPDEQLQFGCPLNNLIQELSAENPIFRQKLNAILELWITGIESYLKKAQADGYLKKDIHPRQLAEFIVMTHKGAFGMSKSFGKKKVLWSLYHSLRDYINSLSSKEHNHTTI